MMMEEDRRSRGSLRPAGASAREKEERRSKEEIESQGMDTEVMDTEAMDTEAMDTEAMAMAIVTGTVTAILSQEPASASHPIPRAKIEASFSSAVNIGATDVGGSSVRDSCAAGSAVDISMISSCGRIMKLVLVVTLFMALVALISADPWADPTAEAHRRWFRGHRGYVHRGYGHRGYGHRGYGYRGYGYGHRGHFG
ncbi:unnamed protein product [Darwinula stevensoni]|uniref:Uncharacterized protein n=1 Tax=Darwinula stevensoni TaxID=69355 RepID=A0A7R9A3G5_9CRUS|nr:unnamed protein product [Darwinula stevensoni]CAG0891581.1 unnamed protein product [Darwinula stevensoni]